MATANTNYIKKWIDNIYEKYLQKKITICFLVSWYNCWSFMSCFNNIRFYGSMGRKFFFSFFSGPLTDFISTNYRNYFSTNFFIRAFLVDLSLPESSFSTSAYLGLIHSRLQHGATQHLVFSLSQIIETFIVGPSFLHALVRYFNISFYGAL